MLGDDLLPEVLQFMQQAIALEHLPLGELTKLSRQAQLCYIGQGVSEQLSEDEQHIYWLRTGAVCWQDEAGHVLSHIDAGGCCSRQLFTEPDTLKCVVEEDCLLLKLPLSDIQNLQQQYTWLAMFFQPQQNRVLHWQGPEAEQDLYLHQSLNQLIHPGVYAIKPQQTVQDAAQQMAEHRVSALVVMDNQELVGILSEKDLARRVLAKGLSGQTLVADVMTPQVQTLAFEARVIDGQMKMAEKGIRHLPLLQDGNVVAMLSASDLLRFQRQNPLSLALDINKQQSRAELAELARQLPGLFNGLVAIGLDAEHIGKSLSHFYDLFTRRLLWLAEQELGPAPVGYAWLVFGSQARMEMSLNSDQDNGLILAAPLNEQQQTYFKSLTEFVCQGLAECGLQLCPGNIMAMNAQWQLTLEQWQKQFNQWIQNPDPQAILNASVFFDLRVVTGSKELGVDLQQYVLQQSKNNSAFYGALARAVQEFDNGLNWRGRLKTHKDAERKSVFNLKKVAYGPLVMLLRLLSMARGISEVSSNQRAEALKQLENINTKDIQSLQVALSLVCRLRYRHHLQLLTNGLVISDEISPSELDSLRRHQVKEVLQLVQQHKEAVLRQFCGGLH